MMTITPLSPIRARLRAARGAGDNPNVEICDGQLYATPELAAVYDRIQQRAEAHRAAPAPEPALPYRWAWLHDRDAGLWTLVVRVRATGQQIPCSYAIPSAPDVVHAEVVAERLYVLRRREDC